VEGFGFGAGFGVNIRLPINYVVVTNMVGSGNFLGCD
jgi:hypothetical protein